MHYILTFDIGTTAVKTCLFDERLSLIRSSNDEYALLIGKDRNVIELDCETYWRAVIDGIRRVAPDASTRERISALSITTQGETLIPVDRAGHAMRRAIVWLDARADEEGAQLSSLPAAASVYSRTGVSAIDGMTPISKLLWLKHHEPEVYQKAYKFLLLGDYIVCRLTGEFAGEKTLLCTTAYYDIRHDCYLDELLEQAGLRRDAFPKPYDCGSVIANVSAAAAEETGLSTHTVVIAGAMDQVAAAVGGGNLRDGVVTETTGTTMSIMATADEHCFETAGGVNIYRHVLPGKYFVMPFCITAGVVLKWFKDEFCAELIEQARQENRSVYDLMGDMASKCEVGAKGLTIVPYFNGILQPCAQPAMRGVFVGASLATQKPQFIRAIFEGVGCMLRENLDLLEAMGVSVQEIRSFGGGANSAIWSQIKADIVQKRILTMRQLECASLGVAAISAVAMGYFPGLELAVQTNDVDKCFQPNPEVADACDALYRRYLTVLETTRKLF